MLFKRSKARNVTAGERAASQSIPRVSGRLEGVLQVNEVLGGGNAAQYLVILILAKSMNLYGSSNSHSPDSATL